MTISAAQLRAARGLLGWSRRKLAETARIDGSEIAAFEDRGVAPSDPAGAAIRRALEAAGILLLPVDGYGEGVRFARPQASADEGIRPEDLNSANDG
ncbi:helix-turn-helix transcriptional regulator [Methylobrevis albus]|uniref:Helix-turn-helix transcriptional regulator n=1 Tax=Methylobrevis albus TaxID=2793297 RepID=A0A931HZX7_9HYPH|nr:helix-turn-helix transcriptional regulator [Methylobrevis albus]MBH0237555.1 helix-turn-helix transcriptional regulator [Methylobrevis albus]